MSGIDILISRWFMFPRHWWRLDPMVLFTRRPQFLLWSWWRLYSRFI